MTKFETYNESIGGTVVSINFCPFNQDDADLFRKFLDLWFKMATRQSKAGLAPEEFLISLVRDNNLALDETSDSMSEKWIAEFNHNKVWSALFNDSPFKLSVQKVKTTTVTHASKFKL